MTEGIDDSLYSRQLYVLGLDAMQKLVSSSVLISGLGGLGVETAKNIILAGVKSVTLHDQREVKLEDLASQFYFDQSKIGQNRAFACKDLLASLNDYVTVSATNDSLTESFISSYNVVVITDHLQFNVLIQISTWCREKGIKFIYSDVRGVFGFLFNDFGENFHVSDPSGEQPTKFLLSFISPDGLVTSSEDELHNLSDNDHVKFEEVEGLDINGKEFPVTVKNARQFSIGDVSQYGEYTAKKIFWIWFTNFCSNRIKIFKFCRSIENTGSCNF